MLKASCITRERSRADLTRLQGCLIHGGKAGYCPLCVKGGPHRGGQLDEAGICWGVRAVPGPQPPSVPWDRPGCLDHGAGAGAGPLDIVYQHALQVPHTLLCACASNGSDCTSLATSALRPVLASSSR